MTWARFKHTRAAVLAWTLLAFLAGYVMASSIDQLRAPTIHLHIYTEDTQQSEQPRNLPMTAHNTTISTMSNIKTSPTIPDGFVQDARGRLVPKKLVRPIDALRDQTVQTIVDQALALNQHLKAFKQSAFADVETFIATSLEQFEVEHGGVKGNVTLRSYDGRYKIERAVQESIAFDERLQAAKALIGECITRWAEGSQPEIHALIDDAFQVDKEGRISTSRVLGLKRLAITDPQWSAAMEAIAQSVTVVGSKNYIRIYRREGDTDKYTAIVLDIAAV